jgi:hypothetical protein
VCTIRSPQAITTLRNLFQAHEADPRFSDTERRYRIAGLYLPFVVVAVEGAEFIKRDLAEDAKMDWLMCFLWVLRNSARASIIQWWMAETQTRQICFLDLLRLATQVFGVCTDCATQRLLP